jgi:hypothetical protein
LTELGSGGEHAGNCGAGEQGERWVCIGLVGREQCQLLGGVEDAAAREQAHQAQAYRAEQLGDVEGSEVRELDEAWRSFRLLGEDAVKGQNVKMWIESAEGRCAAATRARRSAGCSG